MEKWLVTGAAGFLGSHVTEKLLSEGKKVIAVDNLSWGHKSFIEERTKEMDFYQVDIRDKSELDKIFEQHKPTHVIHLAALHFIPAAIKDPSLAIDINVRGTQNLLQSMREKANVKAFWFASTGDVYAPDEKAHHETESVISPFNIYGLSKFICEQLINLESKNAPETKFVIGRLFNLYGSRETNPHIIPEILNQIKKQTGDVQLSLGSIWPKRDMVPVDQTAACVIDTLTKVITFEQNIFCMNYATGNVTSVEEMIKTIAKILDRKIQINIDPTKVRSVERSHLQADVRALKAFLGRTPDPDLTIGLTKILKDEQFI
ncbi:MAG: SDR family NAD(P)-dependent oxidoreductase [Bacteriovorax sp.]|nr:SDR family NAD(P)-dependent oxidoreductase [Bacteriovorax sp.]